MLHHPEPAEAKVAPLNSAASGKNTVRSPLTKEQINSRIVCSPKAVRGKVTDKLSIQYAFVSQRGYYPDGTLASSLIAVHCL